MSEIVVAHLPDHGDGLLITRVRTPVHGGVHDYPNVDDGLFCHQS
jgi:hypothetical protein